MCRGSWGSVSCYFGCDRHQWKLKGRCSGAAETHVLHRRLKNSSPSLKTLMGGGRKMGGGLKSGRARAPTRLSFISWAPWKPAPRVLSLVTNRVCTGHTDRLSCVLCSWRGCCLRTGRGGRVGTHGGTLSSYIVKNIALDKTDDSNPREAILRHAKAAEDNPYWVSPAYSK